MFEGGKAGLRRRRINGDGGRAVGAACLGAAEERAAASDEAARLDFRVYDDPADQ